MKVKFPDETGKEIIEEFKIERITVGELLKRLGFDPFNVIVLKNAEVVGKREILINTDIVTISKLGCC